MPEYKYGEEVEYEFVLLKDCDGHKLKKFDCGNVKLNSFIQNDIIQENAVVNEDGLMFKAEDKKTSDIIAIVSLVASGVIFNQTNYLKLLPAIKIDVFAVDVKYQKMHYMAGMQSIEDLIEVWTKENFESFDNDKDEALAF